MLKLSDRVKEYSTTSGSGLLITLINPFRGFQSFNDGIGNGNTTYYTIENNKEFEVGIGVYSSGSNTLSRDIVLESSNNGEKIDLQDVSIVFCTYPADYSVFLNLDGYISGQQPFYSGIAFPDGTIQTTSLDGNGLENKIAYWEDNNTLGNIENITWDTINDELSVSGNSIFNGDIFTQNISIDNNSLIGGDLSVSGNSEIYGILNVGGNVIISGILETSGSLLTSPTFNDHTLFYRNTSGCFFHAYVDNSYDNMVALYSSNEANPFWRLGIKPYSTSYINPPTTGYIQGENGEIGIYATSDNYAVFTYVNGFWVTQENINLFNVDIDNGVRIFNSNPTTVPLTIRSAPAQASNVQEWKTYSSSTIASINNVGQISINSVKYPDNTVQNTAYLPSTDSYINVNSSVTLDTEYGIIFVDCSISNITLTLPDAVDAGGKRIVIKRKAGGTNSLNIIPSGSQSIDSNSNFLMPFDNQSITLVSDNSNWFII